MVVVTMSTMSRDEYGGEGGGGDGCGDGGNDRCGDGSGDRGGDRTEAIARK